MAKDQLVACALFALALAVTLTRDGAGMPVEDRVGALVLGFVMALFWRALASMPVFGLLESMASDFRNPDLRVPSALISWGLFLFVAYAAIFK